MSLTKADILAAVQERLYRRGMVITDIDEEVRAVLNDLSLRNILLNFAASFSTVAADYDYALSAIQAGIRYIDDISITDGNQLARISYEQFKAYQEGDADGVTGEPTEYAIYNETLYVWPVPDAVYTVNVAGSKFHADTADSLAFADVCRQAMIEGVTAEIFAGELAGESNAAAWMVHHQAKYERAVGLLERVQKRQPGQIKYRDL